MSNSPLILNIIYWTSNKIDFRKKATNGELAISNNNIFINSENRILEIPLSDLLECELRKAHKVGTYVHLQTHNQIINFVIPKINITNWFLIVNKLKTKQTFEEIQSKLF